VVIVASSIVGRSAPHLEQEAAAHSPAAAKASPQAVTEWPMALAAPAVYVVPPIRIDHLPSRRQTRALDAAPTAASGGVNGSWGGPWDGAR
jgi:hypothetical protein